MRKPVGIYFGPGYSSGEKAREELKMNVDTMDLTPEIEKIL